MIWGWVAFGLTWPGEVRLGGARRGRAWHGAFGLMRRGLARPGSARQGTARHGAFGLNGYNQWFWLANHRRFDMKIDLSFVAEIHKGHMIESSAVLAILGVSPDDPLDAADVNFHAVKLAGAVEKMLHRLGKPWTVQAKNGCVHVLTDIEAVAFRERQNKAGVRKIRRSHRGLMGVDRHQLDDTAKRNHETALLRSAAQTAALSAAVRQIPRPVPHKSEIPARPVGRERFNPAAVQPTAQP